MGDVSTLDDLSRIYRLHFLPNVESSMRLLVAISQFSTELKGQINHFYAFNKKGNRKFRHFSCVSHRHLNVFFFLVFQWKIENVMEFVFRFVAYLINGESIEKMVNATFDKPLHLS